MYLKKLFKPFVEDELPSIAQGTRAIIAHPYCNINIKEENAQKNDITLAIGPEGGFTDYEIDKFIETGFTPVNMGERIFKVETALTYMTGHLF